jgi:hypothetical protein
MTPREREALVEAAATAYRTRKPDGSIGAHHAWYDLDEAGRFEAFDAAVVLRRMEAAIDSQGLSTTAKAVLERIRKPR